MKSIDLKVTLEFDDEIDETFSAVIVENVKQALIHERDTRGLVPDDCETYTKEITVKKITHYDGQN